MSQPLYDPRCNSFRLLRLVFALLIIWTHAFSLLRIQTPLSALTGGQLCESDIAVDGFLVISGFLIAQSVQRQRNVLTFLRNRFLRIFPGLACALIFTALIVGGLAYAGTYRDYLRLGDGGPLHYIRHWLTLNVQAEPWYITGVFTDNPTQGVNVSLWTIKHEVSLYLLAALLMLTRLHRRRGVYLGLALGFAALFVLKAGFGVQLWTLARVEGWVINTWNYTHFVRTGLFFCLGAVMFHWRDALPRAWWFAAIAAGVLTLSGFLGVLLWAHVLITPWLIIRLGCLRTFSAFGKRHELSFGLYVYTYPLQQLLLDIWPELPPIGLFLGGAAAALPLAALSWRFLEAPAILLPYRRAAAKSASSAQM